MRLIRRLLELGLAGVLVVLSPVVSSAQQDFNLTPLTNLDTEEIEQIARQTTVRIFTNNASGSGVIIARQGETYTVLTNWHVVGFNEQPKLMTSDGRRYRIINRLTQLGNVDLAVVQFRSSIHYKVAAISSELPISGEPVYVAGFPMYAENHVSTTFDQGIKVFRFTQGLVSLLAPKPLYQGYRLGYTNYISIGMSGGPILNQKGQLVGINGRVKNRDPDFGVYSFEDGTEPHPLLLEQMMTSSWGIPISTYLKLRS
jgi:S1-C subfamily serine protease